MNSGTSSDLISLAQTQRKQMGSRFAFYIIRSLSGIGDDNEDERDDTMALRKRERARERLWCDMPLMSEFPCYLDWETSAKRWENLLRNHPVSNVIGYFNILRDSSRPLDREACDFLKRNSKKEDGTGRRTSYEKGSFEKIGYEWMFRSLKDKCKERPVMILKE